MNLGASEPVADFSMYPTIDLDTIDIPPEVTATVDADYAHEKQIVAVRRTGTALTIAMVEGSDFNAIGELRERTGLDVEVVVSDWPGLRRCLFRVYGVNGDDSLT
jgi:hypothetical protein